MSRRAATGRKTAPAVIAMLTAPVCVLPERSVAISRPPRTPPGDADDEEILHLAREWDHAERRVYGLEQDDGGERGVQSAGCARVVLLEEWLQRRDDDSH